MPFWYGALSPARDYFLHETLRTPGYPSDREHDREILFCVENLLRHPDRCRPPFVCASSSSRSSVDIVSWFSVCLILPL